MTPSRETTGPNARESIDERGASVAAPTAGLHLTPELLTKMQSDGVSIADIILHVGQGTFKPIETDTLDAHPMHSERYLVPQATAAAIENTRQNSGRVVSLGTTTTRALEAFPSQNATDTWHDTDLLIAPGYQFSMIDALMTNFHLPRSTLLALVAALFPNGIDDLLAIYKTAIDNEYRFYSYGDAMLILPDELA